VIAAAADKACEVLGCAALEPDTAHLSFGTAATINTTQPKYLEVQRLLPAIRRRCRAPSTPRSTSSAASGW
jgi:sugar (pentulose or hexulose) kinase